MKQWCKAAIAAGFIMSYPVVAGTASAASGNAAPSPPIEQSLHEAVAALKQLNQTQSTDEGCEPGTENRRSDLCAQWKAADAASASADWSARTFWLSLVGLIIGILTLLAAGLAARYARMAAEETKRGADEAAIAAKAAQDTHQAYLTTERAIVRIEGADFRTRTVPDSVDDWELAITVINRGRSNATLVQASWDVIDAPMFGKCERGFWPTDFIPVGQTTEITPIPVWSLPKYPFYVMGYLEYETLGNLRFRTHFCYKINAIERDGVFITSRSHDTDRNRCADLPADT